MQPRPAPGAGPAASASCATSQAAAAPKAADVESQLAALSSKLGQLTLCLQTMQQQPAAAAAGGSPGRGDRARYEWGGEAGAWLGRRSMPALPCFCGQASSAHTASHHS